jgi:2-polyprenyl-3-methyl-5-hydroxy-6-metoxy-1,4-benzoquinol methylase
MSTATSTAASTPIDEAKLLAFLGRAIADFGTAATSALVVLGDKLGLYRAMANAGPMTSSDLARRTETTERYVREWLLNQAAAGIVEYEPSSGRYSLPPEHALALTDETSPLYVGGGYQMITAAMLAEPRIAEAFRSGAGLPRAEHDAGLFEGIDRFFRPEYVANLVASWIPSLDEVESMLRAGARVADIACGRGAATIVMARAYPRSRFIGFDSHVPSIVHASAVAAEAGVADRAVFQLAGAADFPGRGYDLIAYFDCLHQLGDPIGTLRHACEAVSPDGTVLIVEPMAGERVEDNFNPLRVVFSAMSVLVSIPNALCGPTETVRGAVATDDDIRQVVSAGGFGRFRRATQTPFNRVFEARR